MAKLGTYSYPDIRFGDAVEISARILAKFKGGVGVKGLAWELGMAENSGTLFAKVAALRDFGLVEGRGELRVTDLCRKILHPANPNEGRWARVQSFQRIDLLRALYDKFNGEAPDDSTLLIALEEITKAPREEIIRRFTLIQKHLIDAARIMKSASDASQTVTAPNVEPASSPSSPAVDTGPFAEAMGDPSGLYLAAGSARLTSPLTAEYLDVAINLLKALKVTLEEERHTAAVTGQQ